jgi:hypothetical protein
MPNCQIEYTTGGTAEVVPCAKIAVASCSDCGTLICAGCQVECCGSSFCTQCYDYHLAQPEKKLQHVAHKAAMRRTA